MVPAENTSSFRKLEALFERALEQTDPAERAAFLDQACHGEPRLREELERMLASETAEEFLNTPLITQWNLADPGPTVGRWRILERIGEGGTGVVYRAATSQDGVTADAALKILRPGLDTGFLRDRFHQERQILAKLNHPGIARFIDCGADEYGRSFLAMEYVQGQTLGSYLDANPGLGERVRLLEQVAEAVRYLHSCLVAHGDLKPANILISDAGAPKLLDFGASRLLASASQAGEVTRMMWTPEYASPEQKRGEGPSAAGDIFSLGRLLDEWLPAGAPADLRFIARHCQAGEPAGRYGTVAELIEDIRRWRGGYPVRARRATLFYAAGRFLRRQWAAVALAGLLAGALVYGWAVARQGERRARELAEEARRQAALAKLNSEESERQRLRADKEARAAVETAGRYGALVQRLVAGAETQDETAMLDQSAIERAIEKVIAELERTPGPRPPADLAAAWRRLASSRGFQGKFPLALDAAGKSVSFARETWKRAPSRENHVRYVRALLDGPRFHLARGDAAAMIATARPALEELSRLPSADQALFADSDVVLLERFRQAQERRDVAELERLATSAARVGLTPARQMALSMLVRYYAQSGKSEKLAEACEEARLSGFVAQGFRVSCPGWNAPWQLTGEQRARLEARVGEAQRWLQRYPASAEARYLLLNGLGMLSLHHGNAGNKALARSLFERGEPHIAELRAADPESPAIRVRLARRQAIRKLIFD